MGEFLFKGYKSWSQLVRHLIFFCHSELGQDPIQQIDEAFCVVMSFCLSSYKKIMNWASTSTNNDWHKKDHRKLNIYQSLIYWSEPPIPPHTAHEEQRLPFLFSFSLLQFGLQLYTYLCSCNNQLNTKQLKIRLQFQQFPLPTVIL